MLVYFLDMNSIPNFDISRRSVLLIVATALLVLSIITLTIIQFRSLSEIEAKTKVTTQESMRQTLHTISQRLAERLEVEVLTSISMFDVEEIDRGDIELIEKRMASIRKTHPEIDQLFVVTNCACRKKNYAVLTTPETILHLNHNQFKPGSNGKIAEEGYKRARAVHGSIGGHTKVYFDHDSCAAFHGRETGPFQMSAYFDLKDTSKNREIGFVGMTFRSDYIRNKILPQIIDSALPPGRARIDLVDSTGRSLLIPPMDSKVFPEVSIAFAPIFYKWKVGISNQDTSIEALARNHVRRQAMLIGFVLVMLIIGIVLSIRVVVREMQLAQAKSNFVSNVSHELKTPLALIHLFSETLKLGRVASPQKAHSYHSIIHNESRRLTHLINNILDFAKIEGGHREYDFKEFDAGEMVLEVLRSYEFLLKEAGYTVAIEIEQGLPLIRIDRDALGRAFLNLINNAAKYSTDIKYIKISVRRVDDDIAIEVIDRGIGINRSEYKKIFDKFYRVNTGAVHDNKGSGLGLALVKHIVDAHNGRVEVESVVGKGSRFIILIPVIVCPESKQKVLRNGVYQFAKDPGN